MRIRPQDSGLRVYRSRLERLLAVIACVAGPMLVAPAEHVAPGVGLAQPATTSPHVVFVTGDDEYRSEITMPMIAAILEKRHGMKTSVAKATPIPQTKDNVDGLEALEAADLMVMYFRFRRLPDEQLARITRYLESGKPIVGLRTSTHAFLYPEGSPHRTLNDGFGRDVFGQKWITHHGHKSTTTVAIHQANASHPILRGIAPFPARSWLYHVAPLAGPATILLDGTSVNSSQAAKTDQYPLTQPVAWTKAYKGARVFFTTLGHPADFEQPAMRTLLVNGILWALGRDIPTAGAEATPVEPYVAPESFDLSKVPSGE